MKNKKSKYGEYKKLKTILFEKKVTYEEAAKMADLSVSAFSNKVNGLVDFRVDEIAKLCNELDVDYTVILSEKLSTVTY
jgi:transcriptional regulator with XRE-family HTH domain